MENLSSFGVVVVVFEGGEREGEQIYPAALAWAN